MLPIKIKVLNYCCMVQKSTYFNNRSPDYDVSTFLLSGVYGLDIQGKTFKTLDGAFNYANKTLQNLANNNLNRVKL